MSARWLDLVDPTREELLSSLPVHVDPEVLEVLVAAPPDGHAPRPLLEGHGAYAFAVLVAMRPEKGRIVFQEIDAIATPELLVTVRKTAQDGAEIGRAHV